MAEEEPREIAPLKIFDPQDRDEGDFRPRVDYDEQAEEVELPDPKDSSAQEPAKSSDSPQPTTNENEENKSPDSSEKIAPAEKVSTQPKVSKPGKPTSSPETKTG